jgi:hypothetical protein
MSRIRHRWFALRKKRFVCIFWVATPASCGLGKPYLPAKGLEAAGLHGNATLRGSGSPSFLYILCVFDCCFRAVSCLFYDIYAFFTLLNLLGFDSQFGCCCAVGCGIRMFTFW